MQSREKGWAFQGPQPDIWKSQWRSQEQTRPGNAYGWSGGYCTYVNSVTEQTQDEEPPPFRGGIIADDMGLGKTLTAIALVASDKDVTKRGTITPRSCPLWSSTTLIIVRAPRKWF